jgi:hypothetical protein
MWVDIGLSLRWWVVGGSGSAELLFAEAVAPATTLLTQRASTFIGGRCGCGMLLDDMMDSGWTGTIGQRGRGLRQLRWVAQRAEREVRSSFQRSVRRSGRGMYQFLPGRPTHLDAPSWTKK